MPRLRITDVAVRKLKSGTYTLTATIPEGASWMDIIPFMDGEEVYLSDEGSIPTETDRIADKATAFDRIRSIVIDVDATEVREVIESKQEVPF